MNTTTKPTTGTMTPEQLAAFWALSATGRKPTTAEIELAKKRCQRRAIPFMQQTQLELELINVMKKSTTFVVYDGDGTVVCSGAVPPFDRTDRPDTRKHIRQIRATIGKLERERREIGELEHRFGGKLHRDRANVGELLSDLKSEYRRQRRRLRRYWKDEKTMKKTIK